MDKPFRFKGQDWKPVIPAFEIEGTSLSKLLRFYSPDPSLLKARLDSSSDVENTLVRLLESDSNSVLCDGCLLDFRTWHKRPDAPSCLAERPDREMRNPRVWEIKSLFGEDASPNEFISQTQQVSKTLGTKPQHIHLILKATYFADFYGPDYWAFSEDGSALGLFVQELSLKTAAEAYSTLSLGEARSPP